MIQLMAFDLWATSWMPDVKSYYYRTEEMTELQMMITTVYVSICLHYLRDLEKT